MTEEREKEIAIRGDEWASTKTADRGGHYFAGLSEGYYNGYVAGATENSIQWHDLGKDPNDLPKKNKSYWVYIDCQGNKIYRSIVWQGHWLGWDCVPLAWCEEPHFKE